MFEKNSEAAQVFSMLIAASEIIQNGVMWLNSDGHILGINEQFANELGYTKAEFQPKTIFEVNPSTSILSWKKTWKQLLKEQQISFATEQITADDLIFPVRMRGIHLKLGKGEVCMCIIENLLETNRHKKMLDLTTTIAGVGTWEWDMMQDEIYFNDQLIQFLGLPKADSFSVDQAKELINRRLNEEEAGALIKRISESVKTGENLELEIAIDDGTGNYGNFMLNAHPVYLEEQTVKIYGTIQSLSKVAKITDDLYFTRFCMDYARDMIYWLEKDGTISYVNQTACDILGYSAEELIGKNISTLSKVAMDVKADVFWNRLKTEKNVEFESSHWTKSGKEIPVYVSANYINYKGKEFACDFVRDIRKVKKSDEQIALAKHSLDQSFDMIFWLNFDGTFRYYNDAFVEKSGYSRLEIDDMRVFDFFPGSSREIYQEGWERLRKGAKIDSMERPLKTKSGKIIPCEMTVTMVKIGDLEYSSSILKDVTERKRKELQISSQLSEIEVLQEVTEAENIELKEEINAEFNFSNIISRDPNYKKVLNQVVQVADTDATVLILGETGTGKELLARAVHQMSEREEMPMIKVNCGALPENLIESELFGHERGSFTGAHQRKIGKFERADKGTIFLDEIGELPLDLQTKLLRVLQEGEYERVGGTELLTVNVRVIAATNRDLEKLVAEGKFREDLYYRLNVFPIFNIPLRERREDIPILVNHFVEKYNKRLNKNITEISPSKLNKLMAYNFLGNVRELENIVERAIILSRTNVLNFDQAIFRKETASKPTKFKTLNEIQKDHIVEALKLTNGKVSGSMGAAVLLGLNDKTLTSRMKKLDINRKDYLSK